MSLQETGNNRTLLLVTADQSISIPRNGGICQLPITGSYPSGMHALTAPVLIPTGLSGYQNEHLSELPSDLLSIPLSPSILCGTVSTSSTAGASLHQILNQRASLSPPTESTHRVIQQLQEKNRMLEQSLREKNRMLEVIQQLVAENVNISANDMEQSLRTNNSNVSDPSVIMDQCRDIIQRYVIALIQRLTNKKNRDTGFGMMTNKQSHRSEPKSNWRVFQQRSQCTATLNPDGPCTRTQVQCVTRSHPKTTYLKY